MVKVLSTKPEDILLAAQALREGKLVAFPTETVYGLGGNALHAEVVAKIFEVKERPSFDPLIVHIAEKEAITQYCEKIPEKAFDLIEKFWPGPLTLVLKRKEIIPDIVSAGLDTVAIRMPAHPIALDLIKVAGIPVAAPSANKFSRLSPTRVEHVLKQIGEEIDFIVDGGATHIGVESTVIYLDDDTARILRPGGLPFEEIKKVIDHVSIAPVNEKIQSPGQLLVHYSPHTPLKLIDRNSPPDIERTKAGYLAFQEAPKESYAEIRILSPSGDFKEAAANLFKMLHELDESGVELILAEKIPEEGLGLAIMDRLRKAAHK